MGKGDGFYNSNSVERMRLGMYDELSTASFSGSLTSEKGEVEVKLGFVDQEQNGNLHSVKSRMRNKHNYEKPTNSCNGNDESCSLNSSSSSSSFDSNIRTCLDSIPSLEKDGYEDGCEICHQDSEINENVDRIHSDSDLHTKAVTENLNSQVTCGIVISPVSLAQDLPVNVKSENRFSSVLENLPLVYIPTTHQLVAGNKTDKSCSKTDNSSLNEYQEIVHAKSAPVLSEYNSHQSTSTETILNCEDNDCDVVDDQFRSININLETSSLGETDSLLRLKESDQLTCHSFDIDTSLPRSNTGDSLLRTFNDASSLSSLSTCTDFSVSAASLGDDGNDGTGLCIDTGDGGFMEINLHSRNSFERSKNTSQDSGIDERGAKPKRKGISGFLSRNIFSRKSSKDAVEDEDTPQQGTLGWKLFGRVPLKQVPTKDPQVILSEYQAKQREVNALEQNRTKKQDIEVMSTTALILENRPGNLPTKDPDEAERHRQQYEAMVEAAKKKEQKEIKMKKKQQQQQRKQEDQRLAAARVWNQEILPNWDAMKNTKKARDLWWLGIPTSIRGKVWKMAIGNDLNVTPELYEICVSRAEGRINTSESSDPYGTSETSSEPPSSKESSVELIKLDVSRTFPQLCIFQKGGPYHDLLHSLLGAYACYRPDVGYVQGMSFIAAVLLLNMDVADAFICFANLLNRPCQVAFFRIDEFLIKSYFQTYEDLFKENMPVLYSYFQKNKINPELYLMDWILSVFSKSLPLDIACRIWDVFCRDGDEFLFRTALSILKLYEDVLLNLDFIHLCKFLTKLPEDLSGDKLFKSIECIHMNIDKKRFAQILATNKEMKDSLDSF